MAFFGPNTEQMIGLVAAMSDAQKEELVAALWPQIQDRIAAEIIPAPRAQAVRPGFFMTLLADPVLEDFQVHFMLDSGEIGKVENGRPVGARIDQIKHLVISK